MQEKSLEERFWSKIDRTDTCWEWTGSRMKNGYGYFTFQKENYLVHRFSWEIHNEKIPEGLLVCHHCDNRKCVNPNHLFLGTHKDNTQDAVKKGRLIYHQGENNGRAKLTEEKVKILRNLYYNLGGYSQRTLAKKFNISNTSVNKLLRNITWKQSPE